MKHLKKLSLKKEKISSLTNSDMQSIIGGKKIDNGAGSVGSSRHDFTCCWCTGGNETIITDPNSGCPNPNPGTSEGQITCITC